MDSILRAAIKADLKFDEKISRYSRDVSNAAHGQQDAFCSGITGNLKAGSQIFCRDDTAAQAHVTQYDQ